MIDIIAQDEILQDVLELVLRLGLFSVVVVSAPSFGRSLPHLLQWILRISGGYLEETDSTYFEQYIQPFQNLIIQIATFSFIAVWLNILINNDELYAFLGSIVYFILSISVILLASKIAQQIIRRSVIVLVQRWFGEVNEIVLAFETLVYCLISVAVVSIFAIGLGVNPFALITSLGIGGIAVAFAAQQTLSRLFGTLELYLDRPYRPGEYIRVNFNMYAEDVYGRVEAIGLRSTKLRTVAQNTIIIVPNSLMASKHIENISRGKKVMALLCLDFTKTLKTAEQALVQQMVEEASQVFWGFDQESTRIQFCALPKLMATRARIIFFISSSGESSLKLRKRLLELANDTLAKKLAAYGLHFTTPESVVYIDSPMSL